MYGVVLIKVSLSAAKSLIPTRQEVVRYGIWPNLPVAVMLSPCIIFDMGMGTPTSPVVSAKPFSFYD